MSACSYKHQNQFVIILYSLSHESNKSSADSKIFPSLIAFFSSLDHFDSVPFDIFLCPRHVGCLQTVNGMLSEMTIFSRYMLMAVERSSPSDLSISFAFFFVLSFVRI